MKRSSEGQGRHRWAAILRSSDASQLLELALVLPLLLVMLVGIIDFAIAYNTKQILNNAAREGARIASAQPMSDLTQTNPASIAVVRQAVVTYLTNAGVDTSFISSTGTKQTGSYVFTWTYYSSGTYGLEIQRNVTFTATISGVTTNIQASRVTLNYPYNWTFGFNRLIGLMVPGASYAATIPISSDALIGNWN